LTVLVEGGGGGGGGGGGEKSKRSSIIIHSKNILLVDLRGVVSGHMKENIAESG